MKNKKIIYSVLFLTSAVSCANFKPVIFTNAFLFPESFSTVTYDDINWSYALFNQYASGLSYELELNYSNYNLNQVNQSIAAVQPSGTNYFSNWDTVTSTKATASLDGTWTKRFNNILFNRNYDRTTKQITTSDRIEFVKWPLDSVSISFNIYSKIAFNINVGSVFTSFYNSIGASMAAFEYYLFFYNDDQVLQGYRLHDTNLFGSKVDRLYDLSTVTTGVNRFRIIIEFTDIPPYTTEFSNWGIYEFNLFTSNSEVAIPSDAEGDVFGFKFIAVEWWNLLGHLQNFAWWIVNKSPISPLFVWIDTYIITWVSGLITFITGVFNL